METVVFRSDIARLVLQYLQDQRLNSVAKLFCKSSPYLSQELNAYKQGFYGYSFFPALEEVICEYVKITRAVNKHLSRLPDSDRIKLQDNSLSEKINEILKVGKDPNRSHKVFEKSGKSENTSTTLDTSESFECYNESSIKKCKVTKRKRRKSSSSEWSTSVRSTHKKRRISQPFCFLNSRIKYPSNKKSESSGSEVQEDEDVATEDGTDHAETDISKLEKPKSESTPRNKLSKKIVAKALPEFTQAILDNEEFQKKLVDNINQVLHSNDQSIAKAVPEKSAEEKATTGADDPEQIITSNQLLDELIRNIMDATEKDPTFDAIIQEVVGAPNAGETATNSVEPTTTNTSIPALTENPSNICSKTTNNTISIVNTVAPPVSSVSTQVLQPRTPLVLRHAVAASANPEQFNTCGQSVPPNNNSFSVFMDPGFSISKLIVMNPNDCPQKSSTQGEQSALSIGNTTCEQILNQLNRAQEVPTQDDQVFFDVSTGQLSFPLYLINDGTLPFVNSNEAVIPTNVITAPVVMPSSAPITENSNAIGTKPLEAINNSKPSGAPITDTSNTIGTKPLEAINSKPSSAPITDTSNTIGTKPLEGINSEKTSKTMESTKQCIASKPSNILAYPAQQILSLEGATPSSSGIINTTKISKSLSTPRKRASHVRTLSFSPANSSTALSRSGATPLSTRRQMSCSRTRDISAVLEEDEAKINANECCNQEKPIIRKVEILQHANNTAIIASNESSNSCSSVPPLFAGEEGSNQTVIKTELSLLEKCSCTSVDGVKSKESSITSGEVAANTPKRKQYRKTAVRRCKRQLSKSSNEEQEEDNEKTSSKSTHNINPSGKVEEVVEQKKNENESIKLNAENVTKTSTETTISIEEWKKMRSGSNNDLDARLRAINAKRIDIVQSVTKRKARPKRLRATNKKPRKKDKSIVVAATVLEQDLNESKEKSYEKEKSKSETVELPKNNDPPNEKVAIPKNVDNPPMLCQNKDPMLAPPKLIEVVSESEKRTANIGYLLETPFKDNIMSTTESIIPPTPGIFMPTLDTPLSKMKLQEDILESTSYLFGSLTKSELGTPLLNAITPGIRFTPLVAKDATTPRSVATTEYSSGGSYYRPDESEDLDRNIDKMLRESSAQKRLIECKQDQVGGITPTHDIVEALKEFAADTEICVEIPVETLKVAPIVLKRVKSFNTESGDTIIGGSTVSMLAINPHYKLASGLPEICAEKEENFDPLSLSATSSSSSSSSSSVSSSSSSSSPSSSSSSSSSDSCESDTESKPKRSTSLKKKMETRKSAEASISLENLSEISSTEDEDWQKLVSNSKPIENMDAENSQLIGNDGEVRYPVRSWLTPRKETSPTNQASIKMTLKSAEKSSSRSATIIVQQNAELERKRQRMKEKLKQSEQTKVTAKVKRPSTVIATPKNAQTSRRKTAMKQSPSLSKNDDDADKCNKAEVDVLAALNLSAKKQSPIEVVQNVEKTKESPHLRDADDNATSNIFESISVSPVIPTATETTASTNLTATTPGLKKFLSGKTPQTASVHRKCVQIEALPAMKSSSRASSKSKQIVRTPLGFKSSSSSTQNDATTPLKEASIKSSPKAKLKIKTLNASEKTAKKRISPRLKKAEPTKKKAVSKTSKTPTKVTKRTTTANKRQQKEVLEKLKENKRLLALLDQSSTGEKKQESLAGPTHKAQKIVVEKDLQHNKAIKKTKASSSKSIKDQKNEKLQNESKNSVSVAVQEPQKQIQEQQQQNEIIAPKKNYEEVSPSNVPICDDEDDLLDFVSVTITEHDTKCFFTHIHQDDAKNSPTFQHNPELISEQLKKFTMNVAIDENVTHTWRISDEFCLFSYAPSSNSSNNSQPIRNIPKKRKIRITSSSLSSDEVDNNKNRPDTFKSSASELLTPNQNVPLHSNESSEHTNSNVTTTELNPTDKLEIEDIESILSHIHGAE